MNIPHYHINIFWDDTESCFVAEMPDLKHCAGQGDSRRSARRCAETRDAWLDACLSAGEEIPEPQYSANQRA